MTDDRILINHTIKKLDVDPDFAQSMIELKDKPNVAGKTPERFAADFKSEHYETLVQALDDIAKGEASPSPVRQEKEMSFRSEEMGSVDDEISSDHGNAISNLGLKQLRKSNDGNVHRP